MKGNSNTIENKSSLQLISAGLKSAYDKVGVFLILMVIVILLSILSKNFLTYLNIINVIRQITFIALIGLGSMIIIITTGIDLSPGSVVGLTSVIVASFAHPGQHSLVVTLLIGVSVGIAVGLINGILVAKTGLPPFIVTLGMFTTVRGLALLYSDGRPVNSLSKDFIFIGSGTVLGIPVPIIILFVILVITHILLNNSQLGRHIYALGGNEQAAIISGINVNKVKIFCYTYAGFLAALSGLILTGRIASGQPGLGVGYELDAIAAAVIGGTSLSGGIGTVFGTISGALVIGVINNGMDLLNINMYWQQITKGLIIILAVLLDKQKNKATK